MNWLPPLQLPVKQLVLPGDIAKRQKQPHVVELAESIRVRTGKRPIHLPTIEYPSKELLTGGDRMAACLLNGDRKVWVQPVSQLTSQERRDLIRDENLHRRVVDRDKLIRERVAEREALIEIERAAQPPERKPGRPKTARGEAREQVAASLGTTPDAIRVAEARAEAEEIADKSSDTPLPPPVETYGLPLVTEEEAAELRTVQAAVDQADSFLKRAQAALRAVEGMPLFRGAQQLIARVHEAASELRAKRPEAVCPWCKRLPGLRCNGCGDSGFVGPIVQQAIAEELKLGGDQAIVVVAGKLVSYAKASKQPAAPAKAPAKAIKVVDEHGDPIAIPSDEITDEEIPF